MGQAFLHCDFQSTVLRIRKEREICRPCRRTLVCFDHASAAVVQLAVTRRLVVKYELALIALSVLLDGARGIMMARLQNDYISLAEHGNRRDGRS